MNAALIPLIIAPLLLALFAAVLVLWTIGALGREFLRGRMTRRRDRDPAARELRALRKQLRWYRRDRARNNNGQTDWSKGSGGAG